MHCDLSSACVLHGTKLTSLVCSLSQHPGTGRRIVSQDLQIGPPDAHAAEVCALCALCFAVLFHLTCCVSVVQPGDQVKIKYSVHFASDSHPVGRHPPCCVGCLMRLLHSGVGKKVGSFEPKRFVIGEKLAGLPAGLEEVRVVVSAAECLTLFLFVAYYWYEEEGYPILGGSASARGESRQNALPLRLTV